ncbi:MAG: nucleotide exchange factor GrpE [Prevotellaceae bacterium]|jgi:molecular chaperone GrpE|nr:nucleotide exchange factor GrpE [Prevotellaceae bacterium]
MSVSEDLKKEQENQEINAEKEIPAGDVATGESTGENTGSVTPEQSPEEKMADIENKYLRLVAEFDNYRKRTARERLEFLMVAGEDMMKGLLPVLDDFERAVKAINETGDITAVREGVELIYAKLSKYLESKGLKQIDAMGKDLNTDEHDAVTKFPAPSEDKKGKVIDVVQHGYSLNGKIIRYAKVVVGE